MQYLLDSNIFIQAKNFHYPFDVFPGFWEWLKRDMDLGIVGSINPVFQELKKGNDDLADWIQVCKDEGYFLSVDDTSTQTKYSEIATWAIDPARIFKLTAKTEFLSVADSWLVAKAASSNSTIVTLETYDANCKNRIKIPNVCKEFNVEYIDTIELIRRIGVKFGIAYGP